MRVKPSSEIKIGAVLRLAVRKTHSYIAASLAENRTNTNLNSIGDRAETFRPPTYRIASGSGGLAT